jgi:hypothetical protein
MKDLVTLGNLLSTKFMEPSRWLYATLGGWIWVPQDLRKKMLEEPVNHQMISSALKPRDVYNSKKERRPNN